MDMAPAVSLVAPRAALHSCRYRLGTPAAAAESHTLLVTVQRLYKPLWQTSNQAFGSRRIVAPRDGVRMSGCPSNSPMRVRSFPILPQRLPHSEIKTAQCRYRYLRQSCAEAKRQTSATQWKKSIVRILKNVETQELVRRAVRKLQRTAILSKRLSACKMFDGF